MKTLTCLLLAMSLLSACGKDLGLPSLPAQPDDSPAVSKSKASDSVDIVEKDVASSRTCTTARGGIQFQYTVTTHSLQSKVDVSCDYGAHHFEASYQIGDQQYREHVCKIDLNLATDEYWVFATPEDSQIPTQANYAKAGHGGAEVDFQDAECNN